MKTENIHQQVGGGQYSSKDWAVHTPSSRKSRIWWGGLRTQFFFLCASVAHYACVHIFVRFQFLVATVTDAVRNK